MSPLLGVWCGNAAAVAWAALWTFAVVCCIDWKRIQPAGALALNVQRAERGTPHCERFLDRNSDTPHG